MQIGTTQSQSLFASISVSSTVVNLQGTAPQQNQATIGDVLDIGHGINAGYASTVLQNALEDRLQAAFETAGLDIPVAELPTSGLDTSPEATARNIVDFAVGFYGQYTANHQDGEAQARLEGFVALIKGAVEEGFAEAREILSGIGKIPQEVGASIDETFELTMKGIDEFKEEQLQILDQQEEQEVGVL